MRLWSTALILAILVAFVLVYLGSGGELCEAIHPVRSSIGAIVLYSSLYQCGAQPIACRKRVVACLKRVISALIIGAIWWKTGARALCTTGARLRISTHGHTLLRLFLCFNGMPYCCL
jgi:hypothetical protein